MGLLLEILNAAAAIATLAGFALEVLREHKRRRMERETKEKAGGNRP